MRNLAECRLPGINRVVAEVLFDAKELVVFGDSVSSVGGAGFDLAAVGGDGEVGNGCILSFTGAVAHDAGVACALGHFDGGEGFG